VENFQACRKNFPAANIGKQLASVLVRINNVLQKIIKIPM